MIASMAVYGTVCRQLQDTNHAATIVSAITTVSTILCFLAVIRMMKFIKVSLVGQHPVMKTVALKGLVAFAVTLELVWSILKQADVLEPTSTMNKKDWFIGLPSMIICCAALVFSILIVVPFGTAPYTEKAMPGVKKYSFFRALWDLVNFTDLLFVGLSCLPNAFRNWKRKPEEGSEVTYFKPDGANGVAPAMPPPTYRGA